MRRDGLHVVMITKKWGMEDHEALMVTGENLLFTFSMKEEGHLLHLLIT